MRKRIAHRCLRQDLQDSEQDDILLILLIQDVEFGCEGSRKAPGANSPENMKDVPPQPSIERGGECRNARYYGQVFSKSSTWRSASSLVMP